MYEFAQNFLYDAPTFVFTMVIGIVFVAWLIGFYQITRGRK